MFLLSLKMLALTRTSAYLFSTIDSSLYYHGAVCHSLNLALTRSVWQEAATLPIRFPTWSQLICRSGKIDWVSSQVVIRASASRARRFAPTALNSKTFYSVVGLLGIISCLRIFQRVCRDFPNLLTSVNMNTHVNWAVGPAVFCQHTIVSAIPVTFVFVVFNCVCIRRFLQNNLTWIYT